MYLKQLDVTGFKSFADRTHLTFAPGLVAIVGPNGCGKSNVSDAIRWVLGEQRPTALRCSKLSDVVFNGTDTRKPLGLAEVSITFADCEKELGTDYHEVTVTRRVYRDGSGEYFINRQPSRLKDVQHLFMGTGIGTSSYSVMAQGQIDAILSSKPEDRRAVFEEAAGITKFKADRKEALRKIAQTEQNLLREEDVLREMKRQIGSLQRQVGKAQKYKELRGELRSLDIYASNCKVHELDGALAENAANRRAVEDGIAAATAETARAEESQQSLHAGMHELEERLQTLAEAQASADGAYRRATEVIGVNAQRINEYKAFAERDGREMADTRRQIEELRMQTESLEQKKRLLGDSLEGAKEALDEAEEAFGLSQKKVEDLRVSMQEARAQGTQCDRRAAAIRDETAKIESAARETLLRIERLGAEKDRLAESAAAAKENLAAAKAKAAAARAAENECETRHDTVRAALDELRAKIQDARENLGEMQSAAAAKEARLAMLKDEAAAKKILEGLFEAGDGDVRIVARETGREGAGEVKEGDRLVEHLRVGEEQKETSEQLLGDIVLAGGEGGVWLPTTSIEPLSGHKSPITETELSLAELRTAIESAKETLATGAEKSAALAAELREAEGRLAETRRAAAQAEGEESSATRETTALLSRLDSVSAELAGVDAENAGDAARKQALAEELVDVIARRDALLDSVSSMQEESARAETESMELSRRLTERRIAASGMEQELAYVARQFDDAARRREELEKSLAGRKSGIEGYEENIRRLTEESEELLDSLDTLKQKAEDCRARMESERGRRSEMMETIAAADRALAAKRAELDKARDFRGRLEVQAAETSMRRQNIFDHLQDEYGLFADAVLREPDPEWKNGAVPPLADIEKKVGTLQAEIAALGPVNMIAIEECRELEERYAKEKAQEEDLVAAKAQILELINGLNTTSSEMFRKTFEQANKNFQTMFSKLFGGGEAALVLLENGEDPLECGIDIVARPPGKRPQSVTLLSGGERTMTAVALLFSIFMIKPAPFCMLDELDAALDDANIGRFVEQLKEFLQWSQFLIITHNQHTIAGSDLIYGVSQQEKGVSRVLSMKLADFGAKPKAAAKAGAKPAGGAEAEGGGK